MDYYKINAAISKAFYTDNKIMIGDYKDNMVGVTLDGFVLYFIPEDKFIFDKSKFKNVTEINPHKLINTDGYVDATITNSLIFQEKKTLVSFVSNDITVYVDQKLLKAFDPKISSYKIKSPMLGVLIYEDDILVGCVMPTKYNK